MPKGGVNKADGRDYSYDTKYQSSEIQKKRRAGRNSARSKLMKAGKVRKGDGKDVDHKDHNTLNNSLSNIRVLSKSRNRSIK